MNPGDLNLKYLRTFITVAEELHFTRAAIKLNIAQPNITRQIRQLEKELGVSLFKRDKRNVALTAEGKLFRERALSLLHHSNEIQHHTAESQSLSRVLYLGATPSTIFNFLPRLMYQIAEKNDGISLNIRSYFTETCLSAILSGELDAGLILEKRNIPELYFKKVYEEQFVVMLSKKHPRANQSKISVKELMNLTYFSMPEQVNKEMYRILNEFLSAYGHTSIQECDLNLNNDALKSLMAKNSGFRLLPESFALIKSKDFCCIPLKEQSPKLSVYFVRRQLNKSTGIILLQKIIDSMGKQF